MTDQMPPSHALFIAGCVALLAGCSSGPHFGQEAQWRAASVTALVHRDAIPDGASLQCLPTPSDRVRRDDELIAMVRIRVGRGPFDLAFVLPRGSTVQARDVVAVNLEQCAIRAATKTAS